MRLRFVLSLGVLLVGILTSAPAWSRPCCSDCDSWPYLDPVNDPCARICFVSCYAPQAPHVPLVNEALLQEIFSKPEAAGDLSSDSNSTAGEETPAVAVSCQ